MAAQHLSRSRAERRFKFKARHAGSCVDAFKCNKNIFVPQMVSNPAARRFPVQQQLPQSSGERNEVYVKALLILVHRSSIIIDGYDKTKRFYQSTKRTESRDLGSVKGSTLSHEADRL